MSGGLTADWWLMDVPRLGASKDCDMKKKLLVLLIAVIPAWMPNLATAIAIEIDGGACCPPSFPLCCDEPYNP